MITAAKIESNKKKFIETCHKHNIFTKEMEEYLGDDFFIAPASPALDMYGCYPGGLVDHILKVCKYSIQLNDLLPEKVRVNKDSIIKVVLLAQIGKSHLFKPNESEWHRNTLGKMYEYRDSEMIVMTVGERSAYYAMKCGISLSEEEYQSIVNSDKEGRDRSVRWVSTTLSHLIKLGFEMAVLEEKHGKETN